MDISDTATCHEELRREIALRERKPEGPAATGYCLFCGEPLPDGLRWCDADCARDYEYLQDRKVKNGNA